MLQTLAEAQFVALTTYRRSGEGVATPMWVARDGDDLVFTTPSDTGKVKRLRRDPHVHVQVCSRRGAVEPGAPEADGLARLSEDPEAVRRGEAALRSTYGWQYAVMLRVERLLARGSRTRTIVRVTLT